MTEYLRPTYKSVISILLLIFIYSTNALSASNAVDRFDHNCVVSSVLIEQSEACSIYMLEDENGVVIFQVIAAVATAWLPEIVEGFCERTIGDPDICNAVFDVTSMVVTLRGTQIFKGITRGLSSSLRWMANRHPITSKATVEATTYKIASGIKTVFELYKERCSRGKGIPWESVDNYESAGTFKTAYHSFYTYKECKYASITGNRVNFRTTPSIETYNKIEPQLTYGQRVSIIGHQVPSGGEDLRIVDSKTTFYYGYDESFLIEKGIAVKYLGSYNSSYDLVLLDMKDGTTKRGRINKYRLSRMDNKTWYKVRANGRVGWVYEDFVGV